MALYPKRGSKLPLFLQHNIQSVHSGYEHILNIYINESNISLYTEY